MLGREVKQGSAPVELPQWALAVFTATNMVHNPGPLVFLCPARLILSPGTDWSRPYSRLWCGVSRARVVTPFGLGSVGWWQLPVESSSCLDHCQARAQVLLKSRVSFYSTSGLIKWFSYQPRGLSPPHRTPGLGHSLCGLTHLLSGWVCPYKLFLPFRPLLGAEFLCLSSSTTSLGNLSYSFGCIGVCLPVSS